MAVFEKDVLYVGKVQPPDRKEPIEFTPADVQHYSQRLKDMLADGLQIPLAWEHQDQAKPLTQQELDERRAELAKLTLGHACSADIDADLGCLKVKSEIPLDEDAKRVRAIRFISPEIVWNYRDGRGKVWPGPSITHLAVTPRPVQHRQQPFKPTTLSLLRLSMSQYVRLGEYPMADEKKPEKKDGETALDSAGMLKKVIECLGTVGLALGDGVSQDNFLERLYAACETKAAADGKIPTEEETTTTTEETPKPAEGQMPMMMSLQRDLATERTRADRLEKGVIAKGKQELKTRACALLGFLTKPEVDGLVKDIDKQPLRLSLEGGIEPSTVSMQLAAYEKAAAKMGTNPFGVQLSLGDPKPVDPPDPAADAGKVVPEVVARLSGGRYAGYKKAQEARGS